MERGNTPIDQWLDQAVSGIRFGPDRRQVRQELLDHLEDKRADMARIFPGMTEEEAGGKALAAMGDPKELGQALAKIHKPWLGWLWQFSRLLALVALLLLAVEAIIALPVAWDLLWAGALKG